MIRHIRNKALRAIWENKSHRGIPSEHSEKITRILDALNLASKPEDLNFPGWRLHPLKGDMVGFWSVTVRANWRIVFRFVEGDVTDIDYLDYH
ncbi:MAG: type II toxin-antitoxin system RelE/ParE family toxin [Candidatus Hydrogenedentes bacterium]|nr:type II toxin-antitoxin system RelE/ParE family toxin [Candidatus Hydrogenedentota bacterium]